MSSLPSDLSKLPKWPFFLSDLVLLTVAGFLAWKGADPLSVSSLLAIALCASLGAILCAIPFVADYAAKQDSALDERQRSLEALAQTVSSTAEQVGISIQGLASIDAQLAETLRLSSVLPKQVQEQISQFQQQVSSSREEELEDLERENAALRASEGERLALASDRIHKAVAEFGRIEASTAKQLHSLTELQTRLSASSQSAAQLLSQITESSAASLSTAAVRSAEMLEARLTQKSEAIESRIAASSSTLEPLLTQIQSSLADLEKVRSELAAESSTLQRRMRRSRRAEEADTVPEQPAERLETPALSETALAPAPVSAPVVVEEQVQTPVLEPETLPASEPEPPQPLAVEPEPQAEIPLVPEAVPSAPSAPAPRKRPVRDKNNEVGLLGFDLGDPAPADDYAQASPDELATSSSLSADGVTRLIVTAYIGIGNRLFLRGDAPGLSWEHGVPLQFVSIGKWRWESAELQSPAHLKLLKNDQIECAAIGELTLAPGHQAEVTANF